MNRMATLYENEDWPIEDSDKGGVRIGGNATHP